MAPLAHTLALLAMTVATAAIEVLPLDMANNSFDDQYQGCGPAMTVALPALNRSEFQKNRHFAQVWAEAAAEWQRRGSRVSPLSSPDQAIALVAYSMKGMHREFNAAVREVGRSSQEYRDKFHYKTFHFLLTQAAVTLRDTRGPRCYDVFRGVRRYQFKAQSGDTMRFGRFTATTLKKETVFCFGANMVFQVHTCHGVDIREFSIIPEEEEVLIPPFEIFKVTNVTNDRQRQWIQLRSTGASSNYNCEWLKGGSISLARLHLGGLLLATTALAVVTRFL
ncbi:erythroblast NAD(P)(+)--arginine ADP-ribosyltransferase-like [Chamaea fasciata]|uniref:erythroblast NAD(P)(+)--arginine ADP-ribosyltransferase-like n=1 Tax=Chamaea fasciata TaxID=190680 RepID=UPI00336A60A3